MENPTLTSSVLEKPRRRLIRRYRHLGSWQRLADALGVNVAYPYKFAIRGVVPANRQIQKALGIPTRRVRTVNDHLANDDLQDMPVPLLAWAFENREEMRS